jgi:hypothetical protein
LRRGFLLSPFPIKDKYNIYTEINTEMNSNQMARIKVFMPDGFPVFGEGMPVPDNLGNGCMNMKYLSNRNKNERVCQRNSKTN